MTDSFTKVTSSSWFERLGFALAGALLGVALLVFGCWLLFWNEGRYLDYVHNLEKCEAMTVEAVPGELNPENNGKVIHMSGDAVVASPLRDKDFGIELKALRLKREVQMYQWQEDVESETEKKAGGGTETTTTYTYTQDWSSELNNSAQFEVPSGHENPKSMPYKYREWTAANVKIGSFNLAPELLDTLDDYESYPVRKLPPNITGATLMGEGDIYISHSGDSSVLAPRLGDMRISFSVLKPGPFSVVAQQRGDKLAPYNTADDYQIYMLERGNISATEMYAHDMDKNRGLTWGLRGLGVLSLVIGCFLVLKPVSVFFDVLPLLGNITEFGLGVFSIIAGLLFGALVIALGWLFYRLLIAAGVVVAAMLVCAGIVYGVRIRKVDS